MFCLHVCLCTTCVPMETKEGTDSPETRVMECCEPSSGFLASHPDPF